MSKNKNDKKSSLDFESIASHVGLIACSVAALTGLVELNHESRQPKLVSQAQPVSGYHQQIELPGQNLDMRKEKDEIKHMTISYGATMRSHPISGTL
jgi:hypothetical protein